MNTAKHQILATSRGFCSGVTRALDIFHKALKDFGAPIYVLRELVHNSTVTADMKAEGAIFVTSIDQVPDGATLVLGAHGTTRALQMQLAQRNLRLLDATCPLVQKLHDAVAALTPDDELVLFGKSGHPESTGIISQSGTPKIHLIEKLGDIDKLPECLNRPIFLSQTTMNYRDCQDISQELKKRYPRIAIPANICRASYDRQKAVEDLAGKCDFVVVIGSLHSSNARRLVEIAVGCGTKSCLVEGPEELPDLTDAVTVGVTAGASTPEHLVEAVCQKLADCGFMINESLGT